MRGKRTAFVISLGLLVCAGVFFLFFPVQASSLGERYLSEAKQRKLLAALVPAEEDILSGLCFGDEELPMDRESGNFYLPVDMDEEEWERGAFVPASAGVQIYLLDNPLADRKAEAVKNGKTYRLLAVKGGTYREYGVIFTGLPILELTTDQEIRYEEVYGQMRFLLADSKEDWTLEGPVSAHIRGGSSRLNPKKSYKMTLYRQNQTGSGGLRKKQVPLLGMREDDEWILYSLYSEDSKLRDKLSLDIWNASGALEIEADGHYGYHMEYIEVFHNDRYRGLYGLMEPVDYKQLGLTKEGSVHPEEFLYKQKDPGVYELKGNHANPEDEAHTRVLKDYLACLEADDETFEAQIGKLVDMESALDVWIYLQAVIGMDNIQRNIFYPARYEDDAYRIYFMPWDMDYTWGNVHDFEALNRTRFSEEILTMRVAWKLGDRLVRLNVDGAREKVAERWKELRESVYSEEYLREHIDACGHQVLDSGALWRDESLWVDGGHSEDYESLKELACARMRFLDPYLGEAPQDYLYIEEYVE